MQFAFSPRAQFAALAVANAIAIGVTSAQGPAPSPLLPQGAPTPSKEAAPPTQASPVPELTKADFETFLDALDSLAIAKSKHRRRGRVGGERRSGVISKGLRLR